MFLNIRAKKLAPLGFCMFVVVGIAGCGQSQPTLADINNSNIKRLRAAYGLYLIQHNLRGPESEEKLKEYLTTNAGAIAKMERQGVPKEQMLDIFINERDGKPFKVRYGLVGMGDHPIVFEEEGVDGKRLVAYSPPRELNKEEYEAAWNSKIRPFSGKNAMDEQARRGVN